VGRVASTLGSVWLGGKEGGMEKGGGKKGVFPFFGVVEIREVGKRGGWKFSTWAHQRPFSQIGRKIWRERLYCGNYYFAFYFILFYFHVSLTPITRIFFFKK